MPQFCGFCNSRLLTRSSLPHICLLLTFTGPLIPARQLGTQSMLSGNTKEGLCQAMYIRCLWKELQGQCWPTNLLQHLFARAS